MPTVPVDPALPLQITVDFQSRHRAAFRLFTRGPGAGAEPTFLKEGTEDATAIALPLAPGSALLYEFIFFTEPYEFRAVLVLRQNGQLVPNGTVAVSAPGDALFVSGEVALR